jgi:hypothetical protein
MRQARNDYALSLKHITTGWYELMAAAKPGTMEQYRGEAG